MDYRYYPRVTIRYVRRSIKQSRAVISSHPPRPVAYVSVHFAPCCDESVDPSVSRVYPSQAPRVTLRARPLPTRPERFHRGLVLRRYSTRSKAPLAFVSRGKPIEQSVISLEIRYIPRKKKGNRVKKLQTLWVALLRFSGGKKNLSLLKKKRKFCLVKRRYVDG